MSMRWGMVPRLRSKACSELRGQGFGCHTPFTSGHLLSRNWNCLWLKLLIPVIQLLLSECTLPLLQCWLAPLLCFQQMIFFILKIQLWFTCRMINDIAIYIYIFFNLPLPILPFLSSHFKSEVLVPMKNSKHSSHCGTGQTGVCLIMWWGRQPPGSPIASGKCTTTQQPSCFQLIPLQREKGNGKNSKVLVH